MKAYCSSCETVTTHAVSSVIINKVARPFDGTPEEYAAIVAKNGYGYPKSHCPPTPHDVGSNNTNIWGEIRPKCIHTVCDVCATAGQYVGLET